MTGNDYQKLAMRTCNIPYDKKKDTTLKLRLSDDMRQHIEKMASKRGISMSEYIRHLIESDIRNQ